MDKSSQIQERFWRDGIRGMQFRQHPIFTCHVMRGSNLAAEGRSSQHELLAPQAHQVRQIGMAARKLFDRNWPAVAEVLQQKRPKLCEVEFFARPDRSCLIANCQHTCKS
jgi:hypothetical protein